MDAEEFFDKVFDKLSHIINRLGRFRGVVLGILTLLPVSYLYYIYFELLWPVILILGTQILLEIFHIGD